jgi:hypothetical protein
MSKLAFATAVVALTAATPLAIGRAAAQSPASYMPPGTAPPWAGTTTAPTEMPTAPSPAAMPAAVPATQPEQMGAPDTTTSIPVNSTPMQGMTTPVQAVSLRSGPNTSFPVIGTLRPGMPLHVLATANYGWMQVESSQGTGWAYGSYLAPGGTVAAAQSPAPPPEVISR